MIELWPGPVEVEANGARSELSGIDRDDPGNRSLIWTAELLGREWKEGSPAMRRIMQCLAARPSEVVATATVVAAIGPSASHRSVSGALAGLTMRCKNRYDTSVWPFGARWNDAEGHAEYTMPADIATVVRAF